MSLPKNIATQAWGKTDLEKTPFVMFQAHPDDYYKMSQKSLDNLQEEPILSKVFFHPKNIDLVQKLIIMEVYKRTNNNYLIEPQNLSDLQVVMKSIYEEYAKNWPYQIKEQIRELDQMVAEAVVPDIISQIKGYEGYLKKAFGPMEVMDRGINVSKKGEKTLPSTMQ